MGHSSLVRGQRVSRAKVQRSKELRAELTPQERVLWQRLRNNQLGGLHFRRQQIIDGFLADFYCAAAGLVLELDGSVHLRQVDYDRERDKAIAAHNLLVLRVANDEIDGSIEPLLQNIIAICQTRLDK